MTPEKIELSEAEWLEFAPQIWRPSTDAERMAALVGYMVGDGAVATVKETYRKKSGEVSVYSKVVGAFYSSCRPDLEGILEDCRSLGLAKSGEVREKLCKRSIKRCYQVQLGPKATRLLMERGVPCGRKVSMEFGVPEWVMKGELGVKRAYIAALFGAEGTTPVRDRSSKARMPRQPVLNMCKERPADGSVFFEQLRTLLADLGVESSISQTGDGYVTHWLRVGGGADNLIRFFEDVGFVYCDDKSILAWKWAKYLRAYRAESERRRKVAVEGRGDGRLLREIGEQLGLTPGGVGRLLSNIEAGRSNTAGHSFPHFDAWIGERWIEELRLLRLKVSSRSRRSEKTEVWNILVSSPDHSYLLASGANNFNCFENFAGMVYYPFDRNVHVGNYTFNPKLPIWIGQDFNIDPMSSVIMQRQPDGTVWVVDELYLASSNVAEVCDEIERRYWRYLKHVTVYPDPAARQRQHARGESSLDIFREKGFNNLKYRKFHPAVVDRVNAVNRMLMNAEGEARLFIDKKCRHLIESFEKTMYMPGTPDIDKKPSVEHCTDAAGYCLELEYPLRKVKVGGASY